MSRGRGPPRNAHTNRRNASERADQEPPRDRAGRQHRLRRPDRGAGVGGRLRAAAGGRVGSQRRRRGAAYQWFEGGIAIYTPAAAPGTHARATFDLSGDKALSTVKAVTSEWAGTAARPTIFLNLDVDGNGTVDGQLATEQRFGEANAWLSYDNKAIGASGLPAGVGSDSAAELVQRMQAAAPCRAGELVRDVSDPCAASGGQYHGSLVTWLQGLQGQGFAAPVVKSFTWGVHEKAVEGVLSTVSIGDPVPTDVVRLDAYRFRGTGPQPDLSPNPAPPAPTKSRPALTLRASAPSVTQGSRVALRGTVTAVPAGTKVLLQRRVNGEWDTRSRTTTDDAGKYAVRLRLADAGPAAFRAVVKATATTLEATSRTVRVMVRR